MQVVCKRRNQPNKGKIRRITYRVTIGADLHNLLVQPGREAAEQRTQAQGAISKHDERLDAAIQLGGNVVGSSTHDGRALGVAHESEGLVGTGGGLRRETVDYVGGALADARDDSGTGGVLQEK